MTFLYSFFSDLTAFNTLCRYLSFLWYDLLSASMINTTILPVSCPNCSYWKMQIGFFSFFLFLIHSYTYVVPICPVPKYSGELSLRKKCLQSFKSTPLIVFGTYATGCKDLFCVGLLVHRVSVGAVVGRWWHTKHVNEVSVCLCQMVLSVIMIIFVVLLFGL